MIFEIKDSVEINEDKTLIFHDGMFWWGERRNRTIYKCYELGTEFSFGISDGYGDSFGDGNPERMHHKGTIRIQ